MDFPVVRLRGDVQVDVSFDESRTVGDPRHLELLELAIGGDTTSWRRMTAQTLAERAMRPKARVVARCVRLIGGDGMGIEVVELSNVALEPMPF